MKKGENPTFLSQTPNKDEIYSLAIGRFDGLHLGHGAIFAHLGERSAVLIIENHHANLTPIRTKFLKIPLFFYEFKINCSRYDFIRDSDIMFRCGKSKEK